jgi:hypothetical protein
MVGVIAVGLVIGGLATVVLRRRRALARGRQARARERIAAIVLCEEFKAAIDSIEMALQDSNAKWLVSMSESTTLTEAWREQAEALQGLATEHWRVVSDAVDAVSPRYGLPSARPPVEDLRRSLTKRRELLVQGAEVLRSVRDQRTRDPSLHHGQRRHLLV